MKYTDKQIEKAVREAEESGQRRFTADQIRSIMDRGESPTAAKLKHGLARLAESADPKSCLLGAAALAVFFPVMSALLS